MDKLNEQINKVIKKTTNRKRVNPFSHILCLIYVAITGDKRRKPSNAKVITKSAVLAEIDSLNFFKSIYDKLQ